MKVFFLMACWVFACVPHAAARDGGDFNPRSFRLDVSQMQPSSYPSKQVSSGYFVAIRNDTAFVYLPYMGRVYRPVLNDEGLNFSSPAEGFKVTAKRKGIRQVAFFVRNRPVRYDFVLTVYPDGRADIFLRPDNAQGISYMADVSDETEWMCDGKR